MTVPSLSHEPVLSSAGSDTTAIASSRERDEKDKAGGEFEGDRQDTGGGKHELDLEEGQLEDEKAVVKKPW